MAKNSIEYGRNYRLKNKEAVYERYKRWRLNAKANGTTTRDKQRYGLNRAKVLERDNYCCVNCGLTQELHLIKFKVSLNLHHKNKNEKDYSLDNLETLCVVCHSKKHQVERHLKELK